MHNKTHTDGNKISEVERLVQVLKQSCQLADGSDDASKGSYLLEVYCLEIQLCSITRNSTRMKVGKLYLKMFENVYKVFINVYKVFEICIHDVYALDLVIVLTMI